MVTNNSESLSSLQPEQREAVGLLSIGTFLEYFDLLLYVHMAGFLNELFFPKTDAHATSLLSAFAFCTTFVFRPIGAIIFGYIGDTLGRKITVIITTFIMALSCAIMACLPTYAQIGIYSAWFLTICRIMQGMSSMGELIGAEIYLTEIINKTYKYRYSVVSILAFFAAVGSMTALGIATLTTSFGFNWRMGFWFGAGVAMIGVVARTTLKETKEFADAKFIITKHLQINNKQTSILKNDPIWEEKINKTALLAYFFMNCGWPVCFYIAYIFCGDILKNSFGYTSGEVIHNNFVVSIIQVTGVFLFRVYLSRIIYPLNILKKILVIFSVFIMFFPYLLTNIKDPSFILVLQSFIMVFALDVMPAEAILYSHFPVFKRFISTSITYSISRVVVYVTTSFGLVYLNEYFGYYGCLVIIIPTILGYTYGLFHFEKLEKEVKNYPQKLDLLPSSNSKFGKS